MVKFEGFDRLSGKIHPPMFGRPLALSYEARVCGLHVPDLRMSSDTISNEKFTTRCQMEKDSKNLGFESDDSPNVVPTRSSYKSDDSPEIVQIPDDGTGDEEEHIERQ